MTKTAWMLLSVAALTFTSCGDDPERVAMRDKQQKEIDKLKGDLAVITEEVKNIPADVTPKLAAAQKQSKTSLAEIAALEAELAIQEADQTTQRRTFEAYQLKYQLK